MLNTTKVYTRQIFATPRPVYSQTKTTVTKPIPLISPPPLVTGVFPPARATVRRRPVRNGRELVHNNRYALLRLCDRQRSLAPRIERRASRAKQCRRVTAENRKRRPRGENSRTRGPGRGESGENPRGPRPIVLSSSSEPRRAGGCTRGHFECRPSAVANRFDVPNSDTEIRRKRHVVYVLRRF